MPRHPWLSLAAILGWSGLSVQVYLVLLARWHEQASLIGGLINVFGFFTVLTNTLVASVLSYAAFGHPSAAKRWFLSPAVSSGLPPASPWWPWPIACCCATCGTRRGGNGWPMNCCTT